MITLTVALKTAVPFWVDEYKRKGGPGKKDYERIKETAELLGEKGDRLLYKGDETALIFNEVAESIAILSFLPGGIDIFGEHWESKANQLKGIWANKGFEKIDNLEDEIKNFRKEIADSILKREI